MDPLTIQTALQGGKTLYELGSGIDQLHKGNVLAANNVRPTYQTPQAEQQYLQNAMSMAGNNMFPGQTRAEQNVFAGTSQALNTAKGAASSSADFLSGIAGINGNQQNAMGDLATKGLQYQDQNKQRLNEALMSMAVFQDKAFQINKYQPFIDKSNAAMALKQAGKTNIDNAFGNAAKTASMAGDIGSAAGANNSINVSPNYNTPNSPLNPNYIAPQGLPGGGPWNPNFRSADMISLYPQ